MPKQARLGDKSNHGGTIITSAKKTFINNILAAVHYRKGDLHSCPIPGHGITRIVTGSSNTTIEGKESARIGDRTGCGASISTGSPDTFVN